MIWLSCLIKISFCLLIINFFSSIDCFMLLISSLFLFKFKSISFTLLLIFSISSFLLTVIVSIFCCNIFISLYNKLNLSLLFIYILYSFNSCVTSSKIILNLIIKLTVLSSTFKIDNLFFRYTLSNISKISFKSVCLDGFNANLLTIDNKSYLFL